MLNLTRPLVFLDLEATGTDPETARIIQVAMQRLEPAEDGIIETTNFLETLVDPLMPVPERITELTGIENGHLIGTPSFAELAGEIAPLIEDADLAGYNALAYDVPLLEAEYKRIGEELPGPDDRVVVDPYLLEKALCPRDLESVYRKYTGDELKDAHDARADVEAAMEVLGRQLYYHEPEETTPAGLAQLARGDYLDDGRKLKRRDDGEVILCFGKHRGKTLDWVQYHDGGYFDWMYHNVDGLAPHIDKALEAEHD